MKILKKNFGYKMAIFGVNLAIIYLGFEVWLLLMFLFVKPLPIWLNAILPLPSWLIPGWLITAMVIVFTGMYLMIWQNFQERRKK